MSISEPVALQVTVHGESSGVEGARRSAYRILSAGLRLVADPNPAIADGSPILSAQVQFHSMTPFFPGSAPVQATATLNINLSDVVSLRVERRLIGQATMFHKQGALHVYPRSEESDDPLAFNWLGLSFYLFLNTISRFANQIQTWLYVRYGGRQPPAQNKPRHFHSRLARPLHGSISIDTQRDEILRVVAELGSGELYIATVPVRLPIESHVQCKYPGLFSAIYTLQRVEELGARSSQSLIRAPLAIRSPALDASGATLSRGAPLRPSASGMPARTALDVPPRILRVRRLRRPFTTWLNKLGR